MIENSQHGFTKGKSCLNNLIAFYNDMPGNVDDRKAVEVISLSFSKAFNIIYHKILTDRLMKYRLNKWTVRWAEK